MKAGIIVMNRGYTMERVRLEKKLAEILAWRPVTKRGNEERRLAIVHIKGKLEKVAVPVAT